MASSTSSKWPRRSSSGLPPRRPATCALCPQACAAPVAGSASGCPATTRASSSPRIANVGPSPALPGRSARTPVIARPPLGDSPIFASVSSTSFAVLNSLRSSFVMVLDPYEAIRKEVLDLERGGPVRHPLGHDLCRDRREKDAVAV